MAVLIAPVPPYARLACPLAFDGPGALTYRAELPACPMPETDTNQPDTSTFAVVQASVSDLGMRRQNNQDSVAVDMADRGPWATEGHFFMVADGMGAHAAGELASKLATDNIPHTYRKLKSVQPPAALRQAIQQANTAIYEKGQSSSEFNGMGTTCSCLVLMPAGALVGHVGDSRVYRLRCKDFEQLTFDHSLVWEMAAASHTPDDEVPSCIPKNVITRSLGPHNTVNVDLEGPFEVQPGDKYLLCSDGLTNVVSDELIGSLTACLPPEEVSQTLVDVANLRGGPDNISIVVAQVESDTDPCQENSKRDSGAAVAAGGLLSRLLAWFSTPANSRNGKHAATQQLGGPYGNGPYRHYVCDAKLAAADLAELCRELLPLESEPHSVLAEAGHINWEQFREKCSDAQADVAEDRAEAAVIRFSQAIRLLMAQVRSKPTGDDDSHSKRVF